MRIITKSVCAVAAALSLVSVQSFAAEQEQSAPSVVQPKENNAQNNAFSTESYTFNDWKVDCVLQKMRDQNNNDTGETRLNTCAATKPFKAPDRDATVLALGLSYPMSQEQGVNAFPAVFFEAGIGVYLEPIYMRVDTNEPFPVPYRRCTPRTCSAGLGFNEALYNQFKSGGQLEVVFFTDPSKEPEHFKVSLSGFTAATEFMKAAMARAGQATTKADLDALAK